MTKFRKAQPWRTEQYQFVMNSQEGAAEVTAVHLLSTRPVDLRWLLAALGAFPRLLCFLSCLFAR